MTLWWAQTYLGRVGTLLPVLTKASSMAHL